MQYQIRQMKPKGIQPPEQMIQLVTEHRERNVEFRVVGGEGCFDRIEADFPYNRIFVNEQTVIPPHEAVLERLAIDQETDSEEKKDCPKNSHGYSL